jgi:multiple sugar transport system permease protein
VLRLTRSRRQTQRLYDVLAYAVLIATFIFAVFPIVWTLLTSLKRSEDIVTDQIQYLPRQPTLENYFSLWAQAGFLSMFFNSAVVTVLTVVICIAVGISGAYSLSRYRFRGRGQILLGYLVIRMFPAVLLLLPIFIALRLLGLYDTHIGLALAYTAFLAPVCIWMLKGFFDAIPPELEDAARIDGCTRAGALARVVLPLARPGVAATSVLIAISAWNEFLFALMLTTAQGVRTWPVGLQLMVGEFQLPWGLLTAGGIISIAPILVFFALVQRALVRGLTLGAVKG